MLYSNYAVRTYDAPIDLQLAALPAASAPAALTAANLPVSLQIVGLRISEPGILTVAKFVDAANPIGVPPGSG